MGGATENICKVGFSGALCESCDIEGVYWNRSYTKSSERVCLLCDY